METNMDCTKDDLIEQAISRLESMEDTLQNAQEFICATFAERRVVRHLLFLACKKEKNEENQPQVHAS